MAKGNYFLNGLRTTSGNDFRALVDGEVAFWHLLTALLNAKKFIYIATWSFEPGLELTRYHYAKYHDLPNYIKEILEKRGYFDDPVLGELLLRKAKEGVEVKILSFSHPSTIRDAYALGSAVAGPYGDYLGQNPLNIVQYNQFRADLIAANKESAIIADVNEYESPRRRFRTGSQHQKFWVMDEYIEGKNGEDAKEDTIGFLGGINLGQHDWDSCEHLPDDDRRTKPGLNRMGVLNKEELDIWYKEWYAENYLIPDKIREFEIVDRILDEAPVDDELKENFMEWISAVTVAYLKIQKPSGPRHDVFCELRGPVTRELITEFDNRWRRAVKARQKKGNFPLHLKMTASNIKVNTAGDISIRIGSTNPFEIGGKEMKQDIRYSYLHAIQRATEYIYIENQYFTSTLLAKAIAIQMEKFPDLQLIIVLPDKAEDPFVGPAISYRQHQLIKSLRETVDRKSFTGQTIPAEESRVQVMSLFTKDEDGEVVPIYVHAKVAIIDDQWLTIGSANCSERSFELDTELNCFISNPIVAKSFRKRLWSEHLEIDQENLGNPIKAINQMKVFAAHNQKVIECNLRKTKLKGRLAPLNFSLRSPLAMVSPLVYPSLDYLEILAGIKTQKIKDKIESKEKLGETLIMPFFKKDVKEFYEKVAEEFL